jgi:hypothetical protein
VHDPAAVAREAGDDAAANTSTRAFSATETRQYRLLDTAAVEKLQAASTRLVQHKNRIMFVLRRFLQDCTGEADRAAAAAAAEEHGDAAVKKEQEGAKVKEESGCKRPLGEEPQDYEARPRMKRLKRRVS